MMGWWCWNATLCFLTAVQIEVETVVKCRLPVCLAAPSRRSFPTISHFPLHLQNSGPCQTPSLHEGPRRCHRHPCSPGMRLPPGKDSGARSPSSSAPSSSSSSLWLPCQGATEAMRSSKYNGPISSNSCSALCRAERRPKHLKQSETSRVQVVHLNSIPRILCVCRGCGQRRVQIPSPQYTSRDSRESVEQQNG